MIIALGGLALVFPEYALFFVMGALIFVIFQRWKISKKRIKSDEMSVELLFSLGSLKNMTEVSVANEMKKFNCFEEYVIKFEKTSKLDFPNFGWKSSTVAMAIRSALKTGNQKILSKALQQISARQQSLSETQSIMTSQKYTLIASMAVASAILGLTSSISGQNYLYYVIIQSLISSLWVTFLGNNFYEALSLSLPLCLSAYFLSLRFV